MKKEVQSAVEFLTNLLSTRNLGDAQTRSKFNESLENVLCTHYQDHWFPEKPFKGSGYRCMRIVNRKMDPLIAKAGATVGLTEGDLLGVLPTELTLWIDPEEVSYRIGEDGSIGVLYEMEKVSSQIASSDSELSDDSSSGSLSSSPSFSSQEYSSFQQQACKEQFLLPGTYNLNHYQYQTQGDPLSHHWGDYLATFVAS